MAPNQLERTEFLLFLFGDPSMTTVTTEQNRTLLMLRRLVKRPQTQLSHVFDTEFHLKVTTTKFCGVGADSRACRQGCDLAVPAVALAPAHLSQKNLPRFGSVELTNGGPPPPLQTCGGGTRGPSLASRR